MGKSQKKKNSWKDRVKTYLDTLFTYLYDFKYFYHYSNIGPKGLLKDQKLSSIIVNYHVIEKGLAMPERRMGFGTVALGSLIDKCNEWLDIYGDNEPQVRHAISVIAEYNKKHECDNYELPKQLQKSIDSLLFRVQVPPSSQRKLTKEGFFSEVNSSFDRFSNSRHSVRWYKGKVSRNELISAIQLAQNTPSSCNKQASRIHLVLNEDKARQVLDMQNGNRGFGHLIHNVIVVTSNLNFCSRYAERRSPFIDSGMYAMNLLYSLHFHKIGAIPLVWLSDKKRDEELRCILGISEYEVPCMIIGVGDVADEFYQVSSPRREYSEITFIHE